MVKTVEVKPLAIQEITVKIKGKTPLLMEKMDEDVIEKYNKIKGGKVVTKKMELEEDRVKAKIHYDVNKNVAFPSAGFYKGMIEVAPYLDSVKWKKTVRGSVRLVDGMIPINFKKQITNTAWGRTSGRTQAPRKIIRPEFTEWSCALKIRFNSSQISAENIVNLLTLAGFHCGIGGWRPEKGGVYGQYEIKK